MTYQTSLPSKFLRTALGVVAAPKQTYGRFGVVCTTLFGESNRALGSSNSQYTAESAHIRGNDFIAAMTRVLEGKFEILRRWNESHPRLHRCEWQSRDGVAESVLKSPSANLAGQSSFGVGGLMLMGESYGSS